MGIVIIMLSAVALLLLAAVFLWLGSRQAGRVEIDWQARIVGDSATVPESDADSGGRRFGVTDSWYARQLQRAGLDPDAAGPVRWLVIFAVLVVVITLAAGVLPGVVSLALLGCGAWLWLMNRISKRRAKILEQLPDFVEHMVRALAAGNSLEEALYSATADAEQPIRGLFLSVARQVRLGAPIEDVLDEAALIHDVNDVRVMAMAARVNRRYGGSLRRIFKSLVQAIRERDAAARELRALTAETRFSAVVLAIVPIGLSLYILSQNPDYYVDMWNQSTGRVLLLLSVFLQASGVMVIWRMLRVAEREG
ncbi:MAG: hypothetical protein EVA65_09010 [Oceanococcus sp.]|nr:MAG: hypothetical protein EVA65_09010 [Oceanococcus sp.]